MCTPVLCCAWVCLSLWGSGWCFFCCCCAWRGCVPLSCFLFFFFFFFSLRVLHLHQLTLPPHCCCVLGWGSLNLAVPRVFAALLLALFFLVGVCAPTCLCKAPLSPRVVFLCVPPELFSCARGTCLLCIGGRVSLFRRLGCVCAALFSCVCSAVAMDVRVGGGGVRVFMRWGVGSVAVRGWLCLSLWGWCCLLVCLERTCTALLFPFFVLAGCVHLPQSHPSPLHRFRARSGSLSCVFRRVCVCFSRVGVGKPPCVVMHVHLFCCAWCPLLGCVLRWRPRPCLAA